MHTLFLGTSGFNYKEWKGRFYPEHLAQKDWLAFYAGYFDTVEINNSFYTAVKSQTYQQWYERTPNNFRFAIKGHRYITQYKKLIHVDDAVDQFFSATSLLKEKLSVILWQFPANFVLRSEEEYVRLEHFLKLLPQNIRHAFEFRDPSWFTPQINTVFQQYDASFVIAQSSIFPEIALHNDTFVYIRFHGPNGLYTSGYSNEQLQIWAKKIKKFLLTQDVYVYFNNDAAGHAIENVNTLKRLLR